MRKHVVCSEAPIDGSSDCVSAMAIKICSILFGMLCGKMAQIMIANNTLV